MRLSIISFDGHAINDGTNYAASFPREDVSVLNLPDVRMIEIDRTRNYPILGGIERNSKTFLIEIEMRGTFATQIDTLKTWFEPDGVLKKLLVKDLNNSDKQWYVMCTAQRNPMIKYSTMRFLMYAPDPTWLSETENTVEWYDINSSPGIKTVTVAGNKKALPKFTLTPDTAKGSGYLYRRWLPIYNPTSNEMKGYPIDITGGGWDTATLIAAGKMRSDGYDIRIDCDGAQLNRWLDSINTANTKVWTVLDLAPGRPMTLGANIASTGSISYITLTNASIDNLKKIPVSGIVMIGTEIFTYQNVHIKTKQLAAVTRAQRGSSMAAHTAGDTVYWIEHDIWLHYGYMSATAPATDNTIKPMFNLNTSTNTSWDYDDFTTNAGKQAASWKPAVQRSTKKTSETYTAPQHTEADPASVMGMAIIVGTKGTRPVAEDAQLEWRINLPSGATHVSCDGSKYKFLATAWPTATLAALQYATNQNKKTKWVSAWNEATPSSTTTWTTWTRNNVSLGGTYYSLRFVFDGGVGASYDNVAYFEIANVTITLASSGVPVVTNIATLAEQTTLYVFQATIENTTTGDSMEINYSCKIGEALEIDTFKKTVTYNGATNALAAITLSSVRDEWLPLAVGANVLTYTENPIGKVDIDIAWRDRNT